VKLGPVLLGKGHVGEHIFLNTINEASKVRHFRPDLIGDVAPLLAEKADDHRYRPTPPLGTSSAARHLDSPNRSYGPLKSS